MGIGGDGLSLVWFQSSFRFPPSFSSAPPSPVFPSASSPHMRLWMWSGASQLGPPYARPSGEELRMLLAIAALQRIGTPQARGELRKLARCRGESPVAIREEAMDQEDRASCQGLQGICRFPNCNAIY